MRPALVHVYRWLRGLDPSDQFFGKFAEWLCFIEERDIRMFQIALQVDFDVVVTSDAVRSSRRAR